MSLATSNVDVSPNIAGNWKSLQSKESKVHHAIIKLNIWHVIFAENLHTENF